MIDRSLVKPALHLIIAEDHEGWSEKLQGLADHLRQWPLARTGQFDLAVHACRSVECFENLVGALLLDSALVYATLDLKMPWREGEETPDPEAGEKMIDLCLQWKRQKQRLEFCLVSELEDSLDRLYRDSAELRKLGIRKIYKNQIFGTNGQKVLLDVVADIQSFVRRHLAFCTIELPAGSGDRVPIWFGGKEPLIDLLNRADHIASSDAGVYILFADAAGYEVDWVKLCCELRGLPLTDLDIAKADPMFHPEWKTPFQDPPAALLVRNLDQANDCGCEIAPLFERERFFEKVAARNSLVFFQFPLVATKLDVSKLDETIEVPILEACLRQVHQNHFSRPRQQGLDFAFEDHSSIVTFPSYDILRNAGVVRKTIEFQIVESQRQTGCNDVGIDPEIFELLVEIPWDQKGGLHQLRWAIHSAYKNFAAGVRRGSLLKEEHFRNSVVAEESTHDLGFLVRGRRLYKLLESRASSLSGEVQEGGSESEQALQSLEILWQFYDGLERLRQLRDDLKHQPSDQTFSPQDYDTLHDARSFLDSLFDSPGNLRQLIDIFRRKLKRRDWKSYYPTLDDSRMAAVENISFSWPFSRLPLHSSVYAYLQQNGVSALIHKEIEENLQRYPDLKIEWEVAKSTRIEFSKKMTRREEERRRAERYVREAHSQPVLVHLVPRTNREEPRSSFQTIISSFLIFNSFLALAENHYLFSSSSFKNKKKLRGVLENVELGHMVGFLCQYIKKLRGSGEINGSLFSLWTDNWAEDGGQQDAIRLSSELAGLLPGPESGRRLCEDGEPEALAATSELAGDDAEAGHSTGTVLNLLLQLRNGSKFFPDTFERDHGQSVRDFMRRFLAATTGNYRLGRITGESTIDLWRKEPGEQSEPATLLVANDRWLGRLVVAKEVAESESDMATYETMFPIDDLIRLRPEYDSIWAYNRESWLNLTHSGNSNEKDKLPAGEQSWLPKQKDKNLLESELWESIFNA